MFEEVTNFVKHLRSNKKYSGLSLSIIEEILEEERSGFEVCSASVSVCSASVSVWYIYRNALASFKCNKATKISS